MYSQISRWRAPGSRLRLRIRVSLLLCGLLVASAPLPGVGSVQNLPKHQLAGAYNCDPGIANYSCSWQINESYTTASAGSCGMGYIDPGNGQWVTDYYSCSLWGSAGYYKSLPMMFFCYAGNCGAYPAGLMQMYSAQSGWTYTYCTDFGDVMNSTASERYKWSGSGGNRTWYITTAFGATNPSWMTSGNPGNWGVGRDMFAGAQAAIWALQGVTINNIKTWNGSSWVNDWTAINYYNEALNDSASYAFNPYGSQANHDQYYLSLSTNTVTTTTPPQPKTVAVTWHAMWPNGQPQSGEAVTLTVSQANTDATFSGGVTTTSGTTNALGNFTTTLTVSQGPAGVVTKVNILASSSTANLVNDGFSENGGQTLINSAFSRHRNDYNQQTQTLNVQVPVALGTPIWPAGQLATIPGPTYPNPPGSQNTYVNIPTCVGVAVAYQPSGYAPAAPAGFTFKTVLKVDTNTDPNFYLNFGDGSGFVPFVYDAGNLPPGQLTQQPQYFGSGTWDVSKPNGTDTACKTPAHFYNQVFPTGSQAVINARQNLLYQECAVDANGNGPFGQPDCTPWSPVTFTATKSIAVYQIEGIPYVQ